MEIKSFKKYDPEITLVDGKPVSTEGKTKYNGIISNPEGTNIKKVNRDQK